MPMKPKPLLRGLLSFVPGLHALLPTRKPGATDFAPSCYEIWLKHLVLAWENGLAAIPDTLIELGPGESLGVGFAALLSGVKRYIALDIEPYATPERNLRIFDALVDLFTARAGRPSKGWPNYDPHLNANLFPDHILTEDRLRQSLAPERMQALRAMISDARTAPPDAAIRYIVPWTGPDTLPPDCADMILSHTVLEHVDDIDGTYRSCHRWLRPGGFMTHHIDLRSHGLATETNGHWACSEMLWKLIAGRKSYLINRQPHSTHHQALERWGFTTVLDLKKTTPGIDRGKLAKRWRGLSDEDLSCSECFLLARKKASTA